MKRISCFKCHESVPLILWGAHRVKCLADVYRCHACGVDVYAVYGDGRVLTRHVSSGECDRQAADPRYQPAREQLALERAARRAAALVRAAADAAGEG